VLQEMWNAACLSFGLCPILSQGVIEAISIHGTDAQRATYLPKLISGEWTGTMNLTESQAGSDLNALKAKAVAQDDGTYLISGTKIFITYGDHDMTDNIIHLVLARLPDAPAGQRGISLFLVPKFLLKEDGTPGERNDVYCGGVELKLGIHASPTCTMLFGDGKFGDEAGAVGWLLGEENRGLACMFTMMNNARLLVGIQGVGVAESATQHAYAHAQERRQGKAESYSGEGMAPIIHHPDVQRNLMTMRALTNAARAIAYNCAHAIDMQDAAPEDDRAAWRDRAALLTPLAKSFSTDVGVEVASIGVQVHGGMGFIEETGAAQFLRDARITPIYEGTNGIQAIDLVTRKLPMSGGEAIASYIAELKDMIAQVRDSNREDLGTIADNLTSGITDLEATTSFLLQQLEDGARNTALAGATPYQRLISLVAGGTYVAKSALLSEPVDQAERAMIARFMAGNLVCETASLRRSIEQGADGILSSIRRLSAS